MIATYLLEKKEANVHMSSYQWFRAVLLFLAQHDLRSTPIIMGESHALDIGEQLAGQKPPVDQFRSAFDLVFTDPWGYVNLWSHVSPSVYDHFRHEAALGLALLQESDVQSDSFDALFMTRVPTSLACDAWAKVVFKSATHTSNWVLQKLAQLSSHRLADWLPVGPDSLVHVKYDPAMFMEESHELARFEALGRLVRALLLHGYGTRASQVIVDHAQSQIQVRRKDGGHGSSTLALALKWNSSESGRVLDLGPSADDPSSAQFKAFWGERSAIRRFKDGTIRDAVYWKEHSHISQRHRIVADLLRHVLHRKLPFCESGCGKICAYGFM